MTTSAHLTRPDASEYSPAVENYIRLVPEGDVVAVLRQQTLELSALLAPLDDAQALTRHAPYTWTIKQVLGHMIDCERVFGYRTLRLARHDVTPLPGFDENAYMTAVDFNRVPLENLLAEFELLRHSHVLMVEKLDAAAGHFAGTVNNHRMTTRAVIHVMAGHAAHHLAILHWRLQVKTRR